MTNQKINKAIAKYLGWKEFSSFSDCKQIIGKRPSFHNGKIVSYTVDQYVPNYCRDLNAMHEAEKVLTTAQTTTMSQYLHRRLGMLWGFATASQRAEAFLRTIGK
jgi:hypothetical protein